jgi:hypothetical protein
MAIDFKGKDSEALAKVIGDAGHWVRLHNNVAVASDEVAVQAIINAFTLDQARAPLITAIKDLARTKILAFIPEWKQSNFNARLNELNEARFSRVLTAAELAEIETMRSVWVNAKDIRQASNVHEANLTSLTSFASVAAYDIKAGWPVV